MSTPRSIIGSLLVMARPQYIDYEILQLVINESRGHAGYTTTPKFFLKRLRQVVPTIEMAELSDACDRLYRQGALYLFKLGPAGIQEYRSFGLAFLYDESRGEIQMRLAPQSGTYLKELSVLIRQWTR
jgi:hypothetical protein